MGNANMKSRAIWLIFCAAVLLLPACGSKELVVLMPGPEGKVGAVSVTAEKGTTVLDQARASTEIDQSTKKPTPPKEMGPARIQKIFGRALAAQPEPPVRFLLYFKSDSIKLTKQSRKLLPKVLAAIKDKGSVDISVIGHADRAGDEHYNVIISTRRAQMVRKLLIKQGVDPANIEATSHGEKYPLVPTADGVHEPLNRRVEVVIR